GVADAVMSKDGMTVAASGRDGRQLWRSPVEGKPLLAPRLPLGDLDGDGVPDLLTPTPLGRKALSGRTGKPLWPAPAGDGNTDLKVEGCVGMGHWSGLPPPTVVDLFGAGRPVVLYAYTLDFGETALDKYKERQSQLWLAAVDGRTNAVLWKRPLNEH